MHLSQNPPAATLDSPVGIAVMKSLGADMIAVTTRLDVSCHKPSIINGLAAPECSLARLPDRESRQRGAQPRRINKFRCWPRERGRSNSLEQRPQLTAVDSDLLIFDASELIAI